MLMFHKRLGNCQGTVHQQPITLEVK